MITWTGFAIVKVLVLHELPLFNRLNNQNGEVISFISIITSIITLALNFFKEFVFFPCSLADGRYCQQPGC